MTIADIKFLFKTGHFPETYRKLFRDISSCYLTPDAPGVAFVGGIKTRCTTNRQRMTLLLDSDDFFSINREALTTREGTSFDELPLWDRRVRKLKRVLDEMIRSGVPYQVSWTGGYRESDVHLMELEN